MLRTPLYDFHVGAGARMVDFAGWEMPILYKSIVEEHQQTRNSGGLFDVSHMGRLRFKGAGAMDFLNKIVTRNVSAMKTHQSRYSLVCSHEGMVLDDVIVSRDLDSWLMVCNASNREKLLKHFNEQLEGFDCEMEDQTLDTAMIAVQGPRVLELLAATLDVDPRDLKRYGFDHGVYMGVMPYSVYRSGYTGEDGVELIFKAAHVPTALQMLEKYLNSPETELQPVGLGARDTLRLEAGMPLYGHELDEQTDPLSAGLQWAVDLAKPFIGSEALNRIAEAGLPKKLVGLDVVGNRTPRQGAPVLVGGKPAGVVTSGSRSPTLGKSIAMAYVDKDHADVEAVEVDLKSTKVEAKVTALPFYRRSK